MSEPQWPGLSSIEALLNALQMALGKINTPALLFVIVESILLIFLLMMGQNVPDALMPIVYTLAVVVSLAAIVSLLRWPKLPVPSPESLPRIFARSDSVDFRHHMQALMLNADHIALIGTGLNILQAEPFVEELMTWASTGNCQLEIYLADPTNPAVETRLIEEELGAELGGIKPTVGRIGIHKRLDMLLRLWKRYGRPKNISINIFTHYPTFALMIVDKEYFIYPYAYTALGNFSPVLRFSKNSSSDQDVIKFLDKQYGRVKEAALDAEVAFRVRNSKSGNVENLHPFALYFVPPANSPLYQFGTQVLGYDVRSQHLKRMPSSWKDLAALRNLQDKVGVARDFGFHLTLSDALYFLTESEVKSVWAEIKFLLKGFEPFDLTELGLERGFPDANSISIVMNDPSGSLEALHCELVHRVYRCAAASNYSIGLAEPTRDQDRQRARLMIKRYRAPYILQRFRPHFTLLTNVPPEEQSEVYQELEKVFSEQVPNRIRVGKLSMMSRHSVPNAKAERWIIAEEVELTTHNR